MRRTIDVDIIGAINDHKLKANVVGEIEDTTGVGDLEFTYSEIPPEPGWHPLNYTDPLVLLPGYHDPSGRAAFRNLQAPGSFTATCTLDFGDGFLLRKGATINVRDGVHTGGYYLIGTVRSGHMGNALGGGNPEYTYREFLHAAAPGQIMGIGYAQWPRRSDGGRLIGEPIEAIVSARYRLVGWSGSLAGPHVRSVTIRQATWDGRRVVTARFETRVERLAT